MRIVLVRCARWRPRAEAETTKVCSRKVARSRRRASSPRPATKFEKSLELDPVMARSSTSPTATSTSAQLAPAYRLFDEVAEADATTNPSREVRARSRRCALPKVGTDRRQARVADSESPDDRGSRRMTPAAEVREVVDPARSPSRSWQPRAPAEPSCGRAVPARRVTIELPALLPSDSHEEPVATPSDDSTAIARLPRIRSGRGRSCLTV